MIAMLDRLYVITERFTTSLFYSEYVLVLSYHSMPSSIRVFTVVIKIIITSHLLCAIIPLVMDM